MPVKDKSYYIKKAEKKLKAKKYEKALEIYNMLIESDKKDFTLYIKRAETLEQYIIAIEKDKVREYLNLEYKYNVKYKEQAKSAGISTHRRNISKDYMKAGDLQIKSKKDDEALILYTKSIENHENALSFERRGMTYFYLKKYDNAFFDYKKAGDLYYNCKYKWFYEQAQQAYLNALKIKQEDEYIKSMLEKVSSALLVQEEQRKKERIQRELEKTKQKKQEEYERKLFTFKKNCRNIYRDFVLQTYFDFAVRYHCGQYTQTHLDILIAKIANSVERLTVSHNCNILQAWEIFKANVSHLKEEPPYCDD